MSSDEGDSSDEALTGRGRGRPPPTREWWGTSSRLAYEMGDAEDTMDWLRVPGIDVSQGDKSGCI